ncbi:MAG: hypothetical protein ACPGYY_02360 [Bacteroidia bacterium]
MKKLILPLALVCMGFFSCSEDLNVTLNQPFTVDFTLPAASVTDTGVPVEMTSPAQSTTGGELADYQDELEKLESAKLKTLTVSITAPAGQDFSFVNEFKFYLKGQGMDEQLVASKTNISGSDISISLDVEDVELVEIIQSGEFTARGTVTTDELIDQDVELSADVQFEVKAAVI